MSQVQLDSNLCKFEERKLVSVGDGVVGQWVVESISSVSSLS
jgi:hypothetical protein